MGILKSDPNPIQPIANCQLSSRECCGEWRRSKFKAVGLYVFQMQKPRGAPMHTYTFIFMNSQIPMLAIMHNPPSSTGLVHHLHNYIINKNYERKKKEKEEEKEASSCRF